MISGVFGLIAVGTALMMPLVGPLADRRGARGILLIGNLAFAISFALLALSNGSLVRFYFTFALVALTSAFVSTPILAKVITDRFDRNRGGALGFSAGFGNGFGATVLPIIAAIVLSQSGWRAAYLAVGIIIATVGFPVYWFLLRDAPEAALASSSQLDDGGLALGAAMRTRTFWLMIAALASAAGCMTSIFSHIVPILAERGVSVSTATAVLSVYALGTACWQMIIGFILDRVPTPQIIVPMYLASIGGILLLVFGAGSLALLSAGVLLAIGLGTQYSALPYFIGRYFGQRHFGATIGVSYSAVYLLQGSTPILLDHAFDVQGTYRIALIAICVCLLIGAGLLLALPPYSRSVAAPPVTIPA
jgi:MFS family permease